MPQRQVDDVDVVAHAGAVRGGVVVAEHPQPRQLPDRDLRDEGQQVVRDAVRVLADPAAGVRAHRVEVAQDRDVPRRAERYQVAEDLLDHQLRPAVRVGAESGMSSVIGTVRDRRRRSPTS